MSGLRFPAVGVYAHGIIITAWWRSGTKRRQTNWRAVVPIVGVTGINACSKVEVVGVVVVRVWSRC